MQISNFLRSGFTFERDEDFLEFKFKMFNYTLFIIIIFSSLFALLSDLGINDVGTVQTRVNYTYAFLSLLLILYLRGSKENFTAATVMLFTISFCVFCSILVNVPQDPAKVIWFYFLIFIAYILRGTAAGVIMTLLSLSVFIASYFLIPEPFAFNTIYANLLGLIIGSLIALVYTQKISEYEARLHRKNSLLHELASTDSLTGIMNRRNFDEISKRSFEKALCNAWEAYLLILDIDHFKRINDTYGHHVGDKIILHFSQTVTSCLRKNDIFARIGGEEFAILLLDSDAHGSFSLAEKIRKTVETTFVEHEGEKISITTSIGISNIRPYDREFSDFFARSDHALYQAKEQGRNQTCLLT